MIPKVKSEAHVSWNCWLPIETRVRRLTSLSSPIVWTFGPQQPPSSERSQRLRRPQHCESAISAPRNDSASATSTSTASAGPRTKPSASDAVSTTSAGASNAFRTAAAADGRSVGRRSIRIPESNGTRTRRTSAATDAASTRLRPAAASDANAEPSHAAVPWTSAEPATAVFRQPSAPTEHANAEVSAQPESSESASAKLWSGSTTHSCSRNGQSEPESAAGTTFSCSRRARVW